MDISKSLPTFTPEMIEKLIDTGIDCDYRYTDTDGCSYRSKSEYLQEILGFCGCGSPDEAMKYVGNYLRDVSQNKFGSYEDTPYMFLAYWADNSGYTDHGTTVRCCWLTELGKELLSDIDWCIKNEIE